MDPALDIREHVGGGRGLQPEERTTKPSPTLSTTS